MQFIGHILLIRCWIGCLDLEKRSLNNRIFDNISHINIVNHGILMIQIVVNTINPWYICIIETTISGFFMIYGIIRILHVPAIDIKSIFIGNIRLVIVSIVIKLIYFAYENYLLNFFKSNIMTILNQKLILQDETICILENLDEAIICK